MGFDGLDVDPINDFFIKHAGNCSIGVQLRDGVRSKGSIIKSAGLASNDHNLVTNVAVMLFAFLIFLRVVVVNERLAFGSQQLKIDHNRNRKQHIVLGHNTPWRQSIRFVNANLHCALS